MESYIGVGALVDGLLVEELGLEEVEHRGGDGGIGFDVDALILSYLRNILFGKGKLCDNTIVR